MQSVINLLYLWPFLSKPFAQFVLGLVLLVLSTTGLLNDRGECAFGSDQTAAPSLCTAIEGLAVASVIATLVIPVSKVRHGHGRRLDQALF